MKNSIKSLLALSVPVFILVALFNVTVLRAYANAEKMSIAKLVRQAHEQVINRSPAVVKN